MQFGVEDVKTKPHMRIEMSQELMARRASGDCLDAFGLKGRVPRFTDERKHSACIRRDTTCAKQAAAGLTHLLRAGGGVPEVTIGLRRVPSDRSGLSRANTRGKWARMPSQTLHGGRKWQS